MAAPSARHQGRIFLLKIGSTPVPWKCEITNGFSAQAGKIDATCKSDGGVAFTLQGTINATISVEWFVDYSTDAGSYTHMEAHAAFLAGTNEPFLLTTAHTGDETISGNALITDFNITADDEDGVKGTATLEVQGPYALGLVA